MEPDISSGAAVNGAASGAVNEAASVAPESVTGFFENVTQALDKAQHNFDLGFLIRLGIAILVAALQCFLIWGTFRLAKRLDAKVKRIGEEKLKPLKIKSIVLLDKPQMISAACFLVTVLKYVVVAFQLFITIPIIFKFFEATRDLADTIFGYILTPLKAFVFGFIAYIPNLFAIALTIIIAVYLLRGLKFFSKQIERKKLVIRGFYPEWASPTFNILRVLVIAFTVAMVYPNLPSANSGIFQGVTVLVGVLFSLGSSSVVGNVVSGLVMTYMRPFQVGDRIKINDVTGFIVERGSMVTRVRTHKNEIVSFPNQMVMNSAITNYNAANEIGYPGLIVHADVTFGYDTPWQTVHEILLEAAKKTIHVESTPEPFINQLALDDFYCHYEVNAFVKNVALLPAIYTDLYKNIQIGFTERGLSLFAPHYQVQKHVEDM